jgi:hypothetical protein
VVARRLASALLVASLAIVSAAEARATDAPAESPPTEKISYGGEMGAAYGSALGLLILSGATQSRTLSSLATLDLLLVPPALHIGNGNAGPAVASLGLRVLLVGTAVLAVDKCLSFELSGSGSPKGDDGTCELLAVSAIAEMIAMPIVDFATAHKVVERPAPGIGLVVAPTPAARGMSLGVGGRF